MFIERYGKRIELTSQEVEQAFRERLKMYEMEDAHCQTTEYLRLAHIKLPRKLNENDYEEMTQMFDDYQDCNYAENDVWRNVVQEYIENLIIEKEKIE